MVRTISFGLSRHEAGTTHMMLPDTRGPLPLLGGFVRQGAASFDIACADFLLTQGFGDT